MKNIRLLLLIAFAIPINVLAQITTQQIQANAGSIVFTATQNNAPVTGKFKQYTGTVSFDPQTLAISHIHVSVAINSITTPDPDIAQMLQTADWFNAKLFPQAVFDSTAIKKIKADTYELTGKLSIRDKTETVNTSFIFKYTPTAITLEGDLPVKRNDFGVGQGDWKNTDVVKNEVQVHFKIVALQQAMSH